MERIAQLSPEVIFSFYYRHLICDEILQLAPRGAFNLHGSLLPKYRGRAPLNWVLVNGETETGVTLHRMVKRADAGAIVAQLRIAIAPNDAFNLHGSLLPKYRGRAPLNWVLVNGETETGVTLHRMVKRADAGAIVAQLRVAIAPDDIAITLHHKLCHAARQLLEQTLPAIKHGNILEIAQRENEATCFGRRPLRCIINCAMPRASYWNRHYPPLNTVIFWKSPSAKTKPPVLVAERRITVSLNGINRHPYCTTRYVPLPIRCRVPSAMFVIRNLPSGRRVFILMPAKHSRGA